MPASDVQDRRQEAGRRRGVSVLLCFGILSIVGGFLTWVDSKGFESPVPAAMVMLVGVVQILFWAFGGITT